MKSISETSFSYDLVQIGSLHYFNGRFATKERGGDTGTETEKQIGR